MEETIFLRPRNNHEETKFSLRDIFHGTDTGVDFHCLQSSPAVSAQFLKLVRTSFEMPVQHMLCPCTKRLLTPKLSNLCASSVEESGGSKNQGLEKSRFHHILV